MCDQCGCGLPGESPAHVSSAHSHEHEHEHADGLTHSHSHSHGDDPAHPHVHPHEHEHGHSHPHTHDHEHSGAHDSQAADESRRTIEIRQAILAKNDRMAERNRGFFEGRRLLAINVLSSPGSGKTTFLRETIKVLAPKLRSSVIVGDLATDNDAQRLREAGAPAVQVTTGTTCHLDAEMVARALQRLPLDGPGLLIIENVGNLVCPASYDLGEDLRVVLLSVTEGEDKPLKYPPVFQSANVVIVSKNDLAEACDFDREKALGNIRRMAPGATVFETSARTGTGMASWCEFLGSRFLQKYPGAGSAQ